MPARINQILIRVGNKDGFGQLDEATIVLNQLVGFLRRQTLHMKK
jgi:hypothetical protein